MKLTMPGFALLAVTMAPMHAQETPPVDAGTGPGAAWAPGPKTTVAEIHQMFDHYDTDGSGYLDAQQLKEAPVSLEEADLTGDGRVTRQEFRAALRKRAGAAPGAPAP